MHHDTSIHIIVHIMTLTVTNAMTRSLTFHGAVFSFVESCQVMKRTLFAQMCLLIFDIRLSHSQNLVLRSVLEFDLIL